VLVVTRGNVFDDDGSARATAELLVRGLLGRVETGDERLWMDCELASLAEHRLGDTTDPRSLDDTRRRAWEDRGTDEPPTSPSKRENWGDRCFWLLETGKPVGTIALASSTLGNGLLRASSLYVFREHRGRGVGTRALEAVAVSLGNNGLGMCLDTSWTWNNTAEWYLRRGMWVRSWKRELRLCQSAEMPAPVFAFEANRATLSARVDGQLLELAVATRDADTLTSFTGVAQGERASSVEWLADSTLSLAMALRSWPLVRPGKSAERWCGDAGPPEALAHRIVAWEAWARKRGWQSTAPSIPGLRYADWDE
jgi:GNAT superfamily N-acetyltransferase